MTLQDTCTLRNGVTIPRLGFGTYKIEDEKEWIASIRAALDALNGWDPTGGCLYYYNPKTATNAWIRTLPITTRIGQHVFSLGK